MQGTELHRGRAGECPASTTQSCVLSHEGTLPVNLLSFRVGLTSPRRCGISDRLFGEAHCESPRHDVCFVGGLTMQVLGSVAFGVMTVVNLVVLAAVLYGMFHRAK